MGGWHKEESLSDYTVLYATMDAGNFTGIFCTGRSNHPQSNLHRLRPILFCWLGQRTSVTRFGKISPLWQKLQCLWQFFEGLFSSRQKLIPTSANFVYNWAIIRGCKWTNNEDYKSHLVTLQRTVIDLGRITVWLVSSLARLDLAKKEKRGVICLWWSSWIHTCKTGDQVYCDTSPPQWWVFSGLRNYPTSHQQGKVTFLQCQSTLFHFVDGSS